MNECLIPSTQFAAFEVMKPRLTTLAADAVEKELRALGERTKDLSWFSSSAPKSESTESMK